MAIQEQIENGLLSDDPAIRSAFRVLNLLRSGVPIGHVQSALIRAYSGDDLQALLGLLEDIYYE
jgi:hypothetical protein